jgi:Putative MetA-pathway of phenol degradation
MASRKNWALAIALGMLFFSAAVADAQELEPRAYSLSPIGTTFVLTGFGKSEGGILFDQSLDVDNVRADLWIASPGFGYTFPLAGRQARLLAVFPIAWGAVAGDVSQQPQQQDLSGLADPRIKLSVGFLGAPALTVEEFAKARRGLAIGASVTVMPPLGQYNSGQIVNLGYHRWAFKPEVGFSYPAARWTFDGSAGVWLFTTNDAFYPGRARREQDPVVALQGHVSYALPGRAWVAVNGTWFAGGETRVDRALNPDEQRNTRLGATMSIPIARQQSLKFLYSTGTTTRRGSDFDTFNVTWQLVTFNGLRSK